MAQTSTYKFLLLRMLCFSSFAAGLFPSSTTSIANTLSECSFVPGPQPGIENIRFPSQRSSCSLTPRRSLSAPVAGSFLQLRCQSPRSPSDGAPSNPGGEESRNSGADLEDEGTTTDGPSERPVSIVVSFLHASKLTPGPNLPSIGNEFEYLFVSEDREGEEWTLGSSWVLPSTRLGSTEEVDAAIARVTSEMGIDPASTVVYPDYFSSPIFEVAPGGAAGSAGDEPTGILRSTLQQRLQAEVLVICFSKELAVRKEARRWFDTKSIVQGWLEATGGKVTLESGSVDGTFYIGDDRVSEEAVGALARAEGVRELLSMAELTEQPKAEEKTTLMRALSPDATT